MHTILKYLCWYSLCLVLAAPASGGEVGQSVEKKLPIDGEVFQVEGHTAFLILPKNRAQGVPTAWVWYAPTLPPYPGPEERWMFEKFLAAGIAIAGVDVGESCGSPKGRAGFTALYKELTGKRGLAKKACLLARSRGGLMLYNWACENAQSVACIAGIYPVCNLLSYPGVAKACAAYGMTEAELTAQLAQHNPIERLAPLAQAGVPLFHIHGDSDTVVPLKDNSGAVAKRYHDLGGKMELVIPPGQGHNMWEGFFQCKELVDFVIANKRAVIMVKVGIILAALVLAALSSLGAAEAWPPVALPSARDVELGGVIGADLKRGVDRLAFAPYTVPWLLADISFAEKRIFTNYSGDVSGRFLELASLTSPLGKFVPATLQQVLDQALHFQRPDGHFGADFDLSKRLEPNTVQKVAPLPMFWGNGRILVGLIAAAQERNRPDYLDAARKLGDYYIAGTDQMLSPARDKEYRATGTYGDSYVCDYFPAIEGLALLYRATKDERYLKQAQRMAEFFKKFDALPIDHSHGNLCAWRGQLLLYELTGDKACLDAARAKWDAAVHGGFIWPLGGLGEHWHVSYQATEACSESDWLRFNLDLWRFTCERRYLDMAERVLWNQYRINQCPNGGFGSRHLEADAAGPFAVKAKVEEWPFCCSFHGPLGLYFLKQYVVASSERGIFINFPLDVTSKVKVGGRMATVTVKTYIEAAGTWRLEVEVAPDDGAGPLHTLLYLRHPDWVNSVELDSQLPQLKTDPQWHFEAIEHDFKAGKKTVFRLYPTIRCESRRFQPAVAEPGKTTRLNDVAVLSGPHVLFATNASGSGRPTLLAQTDAQGSLSLPVTDENGLATIALPSVDATEDEIKTALGTSPIVRLRPWGSFALKQRAPFMCNLVVVPAALPDAKRLEALAARARDATSAASGPAFGEDLEKKRELWPDVAGWTFKPEGILVAGGDVGLMNGEGFKDYRFEFDLQLPADGQGLAGWVVRARDAENCVMFQVQSADSPYSAPQFKTKPNTLRPHLRRDGQWEVLAPVPLPKEIRRGEAHHITAECRGDSVEIQVDGAKVHTLQVPEYREGAVGFRAGSAVEQGLFSRIALRKLE